MADLDIAIAGRSYRVACADGEEENLTEAARLVAAEAESLREQFGTRFAALPETRMLLMASLMLGDRFRAHLAEEASALSGLSEAPAAQAEPAPQAGFFDDPVQSSRISELEAALAEAREGELAALAALEEAAGRIRALAGEIAEDGLAEEDEDDEALDDLEDEASLEASLESPADVAPEADLPEADLPDAAPDAEDLPEEDVPEDDLEGDPEDDPEEDRPDAQDPLAPRS
ncbi:cell division protein ZapA [uncultured Albimonas sp.]|uniref:cell division protein ZapA n=1 Tax=uncultured Albimonas sp. TaxID=1331701 RepID=UPI0030EDF968|tara:strand:+ start:146 stop:838 length:693 start_codon:yes stop_codon:yes gene_type:complete